jgi:hypothetical protein
MGISTEKLIPPAVYIPWIVVNGRHSMKTESAIVKNMVK